MSAQAATIKDVLGRGSVHPFPARMAPGLALAEVSRLSPRAVVLDPMVGSGTVIAIARANGLRGIGFDVDPLAVLTARVWTRTIDTDKVRLGAREVLRSAKLIASGLKQRDSYPVAADAETRAFVRYWFDDYARRQLAALAIAINNVGARNVKEALWCAFSRQIIAKQAGSSLARDLAHSRPHRAFARSPRKPFPTFLSAVDSVVAGCVHLGMKKVGPRATVKVGDARRLDVADRSVDLVFTSPPYLNAIDYLRCSKFSLVWMGHSIAELRAIRAGSVGAEVSADSDSMGREAVDSLPLRPPLSPRMLGILRRYADDMARSVSEVRRVLNRRGRAVYVIGENTIRGTYVPTSKLFEFLAGQEGLELTDRSVRRLPGNRRYLPPPGTGKSALDTRIRREVILTFRPSSRGAHC